MGFGLGLAHYGLGFGLVLGLNLVQNVAPDTEKFLQFLIVIQCSMTQQNHQPGRQFIIFFLKESGRYLWSFSCRLKSIGIFGCTSCTRLLYFPNLSSIVLHSIASVRLIFKATYCYHIITGSFPL